MFKKIFKFLSHDIWHISLHGKQPWFKFLINQIRIFIFAFRGFTEDKVQLRASALSLFSLLSIVPVLAMIFGIAKGFGLESALETAIRENLSVHEDIVNNIIDFKNRMLGNINGGVMAIIGLVILLWSVMKVLSNIESSFNNIWQIKISRGFSRKFSDYLSLLIIAPVLLIISSGATISQASEQIQNSFIISYLGPVLNVVLWILSFSLIWFVLTLLYIVMPNTKVRFAPAFFGAVIAGTMFHILQWGYVKFQGLLSSYETIYGIFAALPLFIIWMQYSWLIVLFGAELAYAYQNIENYESETNTLNISNYNKNLLRLMVVHVAIKNFLTAKPPMTVSEISEKLDVPARLVREIIYELLEVNILSETMTKHIKENAYQPAIDPGIVSIGFVLDRLDKQGNDTIHINNSKEFDKLSDILNRLYEDIVNSPKSKLLKDI